jgi:hypothetical protein
MTLLKRILLLALLAWCAYYFGSHVREAGGTAPDQVAVVR